MTERYVELRVHSRGVRRLLDSHPWIFRDGVKDSGGARNGDLVRVVGPGGRPLGYGTYSAYSKIALRSLTLDEHPPDRAFWAGRVDLALRRRQIVVADDCDAHRLVFGESDGLPGLVVDRYGSHLVVQSLTAAAERFSEPCLDELAARIEVESVLARNDVAVRELEGLPREVRQLRGRTPHEIEVREGPVRYRVDPWHGQKTGAFLDQRENRLAVASYCKGRILDGFSYQGGFALQVARAAEQVVAVDSSAAALERGRGDAALNGAGNVEFRQANLFEEMRRLGSEGRRFDAVLLDPPAFAKSRRDLAAASRAYKEINLRAMRLLVDGGILVTSSCSYNLSEDRFVEIVGAAAADARRTACLLEKRSQSRDHPVRLGFAESHYLKCLVLSLS
jgi:23S rRNA (cytosine1962-C5)-methyltransferase